MGAVSQHKSFPVPREPTEQERLDRQVQHIKHLMQEMGPGDKLVITRWPDEPGRSRYTAQLRQYR